MKVFLGGTCNNSTWRDKLIPMLKINYFNPVLVDMEHWTTEKQKKEKQEKEEADFCLYVITPEIAGVYSIAEAVDDSNKKPQKTIFCVLQEKGAHSFTPPQRASLTLVKDLIIRNGGKVFTTLEEIAGFLNTHA